MITSRDIEIKEFLDTYKVASTSTLAHFFFPSRWSAYKRLQYLAEHNHIKRIRDSINNEYIYCSKRPRQIRHSILVTEFYREFSMKYEVANFKIEPVLGSVRPDAIFGYTHNEKKYLGLLEVEISNKGFNTLKYERFFSSNEYKNYFPLMPIIYIATDRKIKFDKSSIKYIVIPIKNGLRIQFQNTIH